MFCRYLTSLFLLFTFASGLVYYAKAQDLYTIDTKPTRGFMPNADQVASPVDNIETVSGKLNIQIPLASMPRGRGGVGFDLNLQYDSHVYDTGVNLLTMYDDQYRPYLVPIQYLQSATQSGGWSYNAKLYGLDTETKMGVSGDYGCSGPGEARSYRTRLVLPDGSMHILHLKGYGVEFGDGYQGDGFFGLAPDGKPVNNCARENGWTQYTGWLTYYTTDGSYLKVEIYADGTDWGVKPWYLYYPDGRYVIVNNYTGITYSYDANGNWIKFTYACEGDCTQQHYMLIENQTGGHIRIDYNVTDANQDTDTWKRDTVTAPGPNGDVAYSVDWQAIQIGNDNRQYVYAETAPPPNSGYAPLNYRLWTVRYVQLPLQAPVPLGQAPAGHNSYEFSYSDNSDLGYGELDYMRMPSGSQYSYVHAFDNTGISPNFKTAEDIANNNGVVTKTIAHDGVNDQWTFQYDYTNTVVRAPDGAQTRSSYVVKNDPNTWNSGLVNLIEHCNSASYPCPSNSWVQLRKRQWSQNMTYGTRLSYKTPNNPYVSKEIRTVPNSSGSASKSAVTTFSYDKNGNMLSKTEFDWVNYPNETGSATKRKTDFSYWVTGIAEASVSPVTNDPNDYWREHNVSYWAPQYCRRLDSVLQTTISDGTTAYAATKYSYDYPYSKGYVTQEMRWDSCKDNPSNCNRVSLASLSVNAGNSRVLTRTYDPNGYGNLTDIYEPEVRTHITYDSNWGNVTRIDYAYDNSTLRRSWQYAWANGVALQSKTDLDNSLTTFYLYDSVGRPCWVGEAGSGAPPQTCTGSAANYPRQTRTAYDDANRSVTVTSDLRSSGDGKLQTITYHDQMGRVTLVQRPDGSKVRTHEAYESNGRRVVTTTPYRNDNFSDATLEWTCSHYDQLGRMAIVVKSKGNTEPTSCQVGSNSTTIATTSYDADSVTLSTGTGTGQKSRKQQSDALGRMISVVEDPSTGGLNYTTNYTYDPQNDLIQVTQNTQSRTFNYSSLGRLRSAWNPESGTVSYSYFDSGDLRTRTDARNVTTTMSYDSLHRIATKSYSDGTPQVTYDYHVAGVSSSPNIGQLKSIISSAASMTYGSYNAFGNALTSSQTINGYSGNLPFSYDWYLNGDLKTITYPSSHIVNYNVDDAGRTVKAYTTAKAYGDLTAAGITYPFTPDGRIAQMKLGNNLWETHDYRLPGETTYYRLGTTLDAGDKLQLEYNFDATALNGNLASQVTTRNSFNAWLQTFSYDPLNRLGNANEPGGWNQAFGYDRWGNMAVTTTGLAHADSREPNGSSYNLATNQLNIPGGYDAAGNQIIYSPYTLGYDAENRNTSITSTSSGNGSFAYDGDGHRVKKVWTPYGGSTITAYYAYDALGRLAAEYSNQTPINTGTTWLTTDMLGSVRAITSDTGSVLECYDYLPFGRMISSADNGRSSVGCYPSNPDMQISSGIPQKFTGKERDAETGLDNFEARYFSSPQGRFLSVDPGSAGASSSDPQSWNAYAYSRNNPLKYTDPDGMMYRLCTPSGGCIDNYSDSDFYWNFQSDPSIYLSAGGSIFADGQYIGYFTHLSDDPWYMDLSNGWSNLLANGSRDIQRKAEEDWNQRNYAGWAIDKVADFIWPSNTTQAALAMAPMGKLGKVFPSKIAGWYVAEHLFDRMAQDLGHRIPSQVIEQVIKYGQTLPGRGAGLIVKYLPGVNEKGVTVLLDVMKNEIIMARIGKP